MASRQHHVSAHDVARVLRELLPNVGIVKLHKLLYYIQGWSLVWLDDVCFTEDVEAWANGPVIADLWRDEKHGRPKPAPCDLSSEQMDVVMYVLRRYGSSTGKQLIRQTHSEAPWLDLAEDDGPSGDDVITDAALRQWFGAESDFERHRAETRALVSSGIYSFNAHTLTDDQRDQVDALIARRAAAV